MIIQRLKIHHVTPPGRIPGHCIPWTITRTGAIFQYNMKTFDIKDLFYASWDELNADQAALVIFFNNRLKSLLKRSIRGKIKAGEYQLRILRILCKKPKILKRITPEQIIDIFEDLSFIDTPVYRFHIPWIRTKAGTLKAPGEKLNTFTFYQLIKADAEYSKLLILTSELKQEQYHSLNRLISILYQPEQYQFDEEMIEISAGSLPARLTFDLKYLILHTYANCRSYIVNERCPDLFNKGVEGSNKIEYTGKMWQDLLFDLSETPAFSGLDTAKNARIFNALDYLEKKVKEIPKMKK